LLAGLGPLSLALFTPAGFGLGMLGVSGGYFLGAVALAEPAVALVAVLSCIMWRRHRPATL